MRQTVGSGRVGRAPPDGPAVGVTRPWVDTVASVPDPRVAPRPRCGFLHIPKTAGTSVHAALVTSYGAASVSVFRFDDAQFGRFTDWDSMSPEVRATILHREEPIPESARSASVVSGHFRYPTITALVPPADVFTVLREPRARLLSHHLFFAALADRDAGFGTYRMRRHASEGLKRFLADPATAHQTDNLQVRMLADLDVDPARALSDAERHDVIASARRNLATLGCVTVVESPGFWRDVASFVGFTVPERHENVTTVDIGTLPFGGPQLDPETLDLLDERTAADRVVYLETVSTVLGVDAAASVAFAERAFTRQVEAYGRLIGASARSPVAPGDPPPARVSRVRARLVGLARRAGRAVR